MGHFDIEVGSWVDDGPRFDIETGSVVDNGPRFNIETGSFASPDNGRQLQRDRYNSDPTLIPFGPVKSARYLAGDRSVALEHPDMGIYNDNVGDDLGAQLLWWGPLAPEKSDNSFDSFMNKLTVGVVAVSYIIGGAYAAGVALGAEGVAAAGAGEAGAAGAAEAGAVGIDASTGLFAGESAASGVAGAEITGSAAAAGTGIDASTGLFAGESATSGAAGSGSLLPAGALESAKSAGLSAAKSAITGAVAKLAAGLGSLLKPQPTAQVASAPASSAAPAQIDPLVAVAAVAALLLLGSN